MMHNTRKNRTQNQRNFIIASPTQGGSMFPVIKQQCRLVVQPLLPGKHYGRGDIVVAMSQDGQLIAHRVVHVLNSGRRTSYILKGDANSAPDNEEFLQNHIFGRVTHIYYRHYTITLTDPKQRFLQKIFLYLSLIGILSLKQWQSLRLRQNNFFKILYRKIMGE